MPARQEQPPLPSSSHRQGEGRGVGAAHVLKYTALFGGVQVLTMLVGLVRNKIAALLLGPAGMAVVALLNNAVSLLNQGTNFGISFSAVKHVAELTEADDPRRMQAFVRTVRLWSLSTALFGCLLCVVLAPLLSKWTFESSEHTGTFILLAPMVGMLALTGGEIAILKGAKRLRPVATISALTSLATLLICCPIYYFYGIPGIAPALVISQAAILLLHLHFSTRVFPWRGTFTHLRTSFVSGLPMLRLGVAFIVAGIFGKGAEYVIRTLILRFGDLDDVGFYSTGYALTVGYTSLVFMAIEADFFPRLSTCAGNQRRQNETINQQMEVCLLLITPLLIAVALFMPLIIRLLYSGAFLQSVPMAVCATLYMYFKALTLPVSYLPLAKGDSLMYMVTEFLYDLFVAAAIPVAFLYYRLLGAGGALAAAGLFDLLLIHLVYRRRYAYRIEGRALPVYLLQFLLLAATIAVSLAPSLSWRFAVGAPALIASAAVSLHILRKRDALRHLPIHFLRKR